VVKRGRDSGRFVAFPAAPEAKAKSEFRNFLVFGFPRGGRCTLQNEPAMTSPSNLEGP
jgi:hypothetical protein